MIYPKTFITVLFLILSSHLYLFSGVIMDEKKHIIAKKSQEKPLKLSHVRIKVLQKEVKKVNEIKAVEKTITPKKQKIVKKKTKKKVIKKVIVKKPLKKVVKKIEKKQKPKKKIVPTTVKKIKDIKAKPILSVSEKNAIQNKYLLELKTLIEKHKQYPSRAKRLQQQGIVMLHFTILKNGSFSNIQIKKECKFKRLNKAALNLIKQLNFFKKIPEKLEKQTWDIQVPIEYKIIR
jgi:protein TonB